MHEVFHAMTLSLRLQLPFVAAQPESSLVYLAGFFRYNRLRENCGRNSGMRQIHFAGGQLAMKSTLFRGIITAKNFSFRSIDITIKDMRSRLVTLQYSFPSEDVRRNMIDSLEDGMVIEGYLDGAFSPMVAVYKGVGVITVIDPLELTPSGRKLTTNSFRLEGPALKTTENSRTMKSGRFTCLRIVPRLPLATHFHRRGKSKRRSISAWTNSLERLARVQPLTGSVSSLPPSLV